jgi:nitrogen fixation/metabolism regulation signal transduction histidine kinase
VVFGVEAQILDDFERAARFAATYGTLYEAPRTYLAGRVVLAYALLLMVVAGISIWFGVVQTRRMARRIHMLSRATRSVAEGDLDVRLAPGNEDEVGELIASFNRMVEEISSARTRLEYLQKISAWQDIARRLAHEIKNPLTPIHLAVQQMKNKYRDNDPAFGPLLFQSVDIIEEEVATLSRLVSDFSAFAKLPRVSPEPVELGAFLADCRSSLDYMGEQKNIDIVFEMPGEHIVVDMDVMMMKRVMDNLVRNAAEALADADVTGPRVRISARTAGTKGKKEAQIRIEDNGPGIRPEHHPSIFEPYFTTKEEGTGLGLAIAKKIVLDHNGIIRIDETRPSGACFIVQLPVAAGAKAAAKEERA